MRSIKHCIYVGKAFGLLVTCVGCDLGSSQEPSGAEAGVSDAAASTSGKTNSAEPGTSSASEPSVDSTSGPRSSQSSTSSASTLSREADEDSGTTGLDGGPITTSSEPQLSTASNREAGAETVGDAGTGVSSLDHDAASSDGPSSVDHDAASSDGSSSVDHDAVSSDGASSDAAAPLQVSTHGAWCANPIPIVVVKGSGSILNNPWDNLSQVDATVLERLTICPGEQTPFCDATAAGALVSVMVRDCQLPPQVCPLPGAPAASGCSQTTMEDIYSGSFEVESSHYLAQGCCFEEQLGEVYTTACTAELEGARCPSSNPCLDNGYCVAGECTEGPVRNCDDGFFCNGEEQCLAGVGCVPGDVPQFDDDPCTLDSCIEETQNVEHATAACAEACETRAVNAGFVGITPSKQRPDLNDYATAPEGTPFEVTVDVPCGGEVVPELPTTYGEWSCARTARGEVYVVNEWGVRVSQPVATGCSYEMQYWEVKASGMNAYEGFVFGCCLDTVPFDPASPNLEPLPPGP